MEKISCTDRVINEVFHSQKRETFHTYS